MLVTDSSKVHSLHAFLALHLYRRPGAGSANDGTTDQVHHPFELLYAYWVNGGLENEDRNTIEGQIIGGINEHSTT